MRGYSRQFDHRRLEVGAALARRDGNPARTPTHVEQVSESFEAEGRGQLPAGGERASMQATEEGGKFVIRHRCEIVFALRCTVHEWTEPP